MEWKKGCLEPQKGRVMRIYEEYVTLEYNNYSMVCEKAMEIIQEFSEYPVKLLTNGGILGYFENKLDAKNLTSNELEDFCHDGHTKIIIGEMEEKLKIIIDPFYEDVSFLTAYDNRKSLQARIKKLKMPDVV